MDLGTYERLLDQNLTRKNFTTAARSSARSSAGSAGVCTSVATSSGSRT
jgi:hypothetical protein